MQNAYDSLALLNNMAPVTLNPTHVYVRFLPKDSLEYSTMLSLGTEFFDIPLNYESTEDISSYRDQNVADTVITWQYTVVPYGTSLPNVQHEALDTCYIPNGQRQSVDYLLEELAHRLANPDYYCDDHRINYTPARANPCGYVTVSMNGNAVPVRGVKVKVWNFVKTAWAYTDSDGYYYISTSFSSDPHYSVCFENYIGFAEYDGLLSPTPTWAGSIRKDKEGFDFYFDDTQDAWFPAVVNNRVVEYFDLCASESRQAPPADLRILLWNGQATVNGAPMLKHIGFYNCAGATLYEIAHNLLHIVGTIPALALLVLKYALPDLIYLNIQNYSDCEELLHRSVFHELNHASHYAQAGLSVWSGLIAHTLRSNVGGSVYGDGTINDSAQDACELAEAWAYANERQLISDYGYSNTNPGGDKWFNPSIVAVWDLYKASSLLSEKQVLDNMTSSVLSIDDLCSSLSSSYPNKLIWINNAFASQHVLANQTVWRVVNSTSQTLVFSIRKGSIVKHVSVPANFSFYLTSIPATGQGFYATWNSTYSSYNPDEFFIRKQSNLAKVYHQTGNGNVVQAMNRPFFVENQWSATTTHYNVGDNNITEYVYTITNADIQ